jgi:excisionase family DNA binding protein
MERLLTVKETAEILQCHPKTIYRNIDIPSLEIPGVGVRIKKSDLESFINQRTPREHSLMRLPDPLNSSKPFILTDLAVFDRLYLKSNKGGNCGSMSGKKTRWNYGFGTVYVRKTKHGNERWYVDFLVNGKRNREVVKYAQDRSDAVLHLQEKVSECFKGNHREIERKKPVKFAELAGRYLQDYSKVMKKSFKSDLYIVNAHLIPFFGDLEVDQISCLHLERYRAERLTAGVKKSTTNRELAILSRIFSLGIDWGFSSENPVRKIKFFSEQDSVKERILTQEEEVRLLEASPGHLKPILKVALNTGMRRGEILGLRWSQVDLDKKTIRVERTKSGRNRYVFLNSDLHSIFEELHQAEEKSEHVFRNSRTGQPFRDVKKAFKSACEKAGIQNLRFHDLRHTFASRLVERGADLITVKELLGHGTVKMTERYTHPNQAQKQKAVETLSHNGSAIPENPSGLSHICHAETDSPPGTPPKGSLSIN